MKDKVIYYRDEINDDFAGNNIKTKPLPDKYDYSHKNVIWRFFAFILYYFIAFPLVSLYNLIRHGERIKNRKILKPYKRNGYFIYGNHTMIAADAFTSPRVTFPKKTNVIVNPDAFSIPVVSHLVEMLGGVPIATNLNGMRKFSNAIHDYAERGKVVMIFPEAHIWPYYSGIRPFKDVSFKYPAQENKPVFCFTKTFQKRKFFKRPRVVVYVDGPFFPQATLNVKQNQKYLRERVYETMVERSKMSNVEYVRYIKVEDNAKISGIADVETATANA